MKQSKIQWYLYMVKCKDESLYTGITTDLKRRVWQHNNKLGAKSLKGKLPVELIYSEEFYNKIDAAKREREIKGWRREKKLSLIYGLP
jgi:putative endonuclease